MNSWIAWIASSLVCHNVSISESMFGMSIDVMCHLQLPSTSAPKYWTKNCKALIVTGCFLNVFTWCSFWFLPPNPPVCFSGGLWCYFILIAILLSKSKSIMQIAQSSLNESTITRLLLMLWPSSPNWLAIPLANLARRVAPDTIDCCNDFGCLKDFMWCLFWSLLRCNTSNIQKNQYNPQNVKNFSIIFIRF